MLGLLTIIEIFLTAVLAQCIYYRYLHPLSRYPGPFLASFSDLWKCVAYMGGEHHLIEKKLHERFGRVIRTGPNSLSFSGLSDFDAIYGFNKYIEKGEFYDFGRDKRQVENIFSSRTDASHREHRRKVVGPALSTTKIGSYEQIISKNVSVLLFRLTSLLEDRPTIDIATIIHRHTFDTMVEITFGKPICPQPYTDSKASTGILFAFRSMSKFAWGSSLLPWFGWLMNTRPMLHLTRRLTYDSEGNLTGVGALIASTRKLVLEYPEEAIKSSQPSIVKNYLSVPEDNNNRMSPDQIWRESFNLIFAGPGSTAAALTSLIFRLGTPEGRAWQSRIRAEQDKLGNSVDRGGVLSSSNIPPVLLAVIKETLRLDAPFPTAFPRVITQGAESAIPGLPAPLPVGTIVSAHTYVLGHAKEIWGEDAEVWRPDRWLGLESEGERKEMEEKFVPFSKGARGCVGKEIAMFMIAKAINAVLGTWDVTATGAPKGKSLLEMQYNECIISFSQIVEKGELDFEQR